MFVDKIQFQGCSDNVYVTFTKKNQCMIIDQRMNFAVGEKQRRRITTQLINKHIVLPFTLRNRVTEQHPKD
ncbi:MAG: hypothetical protein LH629_09185 [Ignavibacteria bacterium]|nr:hypothetical protein [Ignavibacteria bacterium]